MLTVGVVAVAVVVVTLVEVTGNVGAADDGNGVLGASVAGAVEVGDAVAATSEVVTRAASSVVAPVPKPTTISKGDVSLILAVASSTADFVASVGRNIIAMMSTSIGLPVLFGAVAMDTSRISRRSTSGNSRVKATMVASATASGDALVNPFGISNRISWLDSVGDRVGFFVGAKVALGFCRVGVLLGNTLGKVDGRPEGKVLGECEGTQVKPTSVGLRVVGDKLGEEVLGVSVGFFVGVLDGTDDVGASLGEIDGIYVGVAEGESVAPGLVGAELCGDADGDVDGETDGLDDVGSTVGLELAGLIDGAEAVGSDVGVCEGDENVGVAVGDVVGDADEG